MNPRFLQSLRSKYKNANYGADNDPLAPLLKKYREYRASTLLDVAAVASQLSIDQLGDAQDVDPLVAKAIHDVAPDFDTRAFHSDEEWMGVLNSAKGKYFEYLVAQRLNEGYAVGDFVLPTGYRAEVAISVTQPGWDLAILDGHGNVDEYLQLKASDSAAYIRTALERYPEIKILATSEVSGDLADTHMVLDSGMTEDQVRDAVQAVIDHDASFLHHFWESFNPLFSLLLVAGMQGYQVAIGKQSLRDGYEVAMSRAERILVAAAAGALVKALGGGWLSVPAAIAAGIWVTDRRKIDALVAEVSRRKETLALQAERYAPPGV